VQYRGAIPNVSHLPHWRINVAAIIAAWKASAVRDVMWRARARARGYQSYIDKNLGASLG